MADSRGFGALRSALLRSRVLIAALATGIGAAAAIYVVTQQMRVPPPLAAFGQSRRALQVVALRAYAARAELGSLVPQTDAVIAIREQFLQRVINRSLPFRQYFEDGRYVARLDRAEVRLESGLATVTLLGRGMQAGQEDSPFFADLFVAGLMNVSGIDPDNGTLQAALVITDVRARRAGRRDLQALLNPVARYFGRLKAQDWNRNRQQIHLPLRFDREIVLSALNGDVSLGESRIPVSIRVSAVTTLEDHMAVSLALVPDSESDDKRYGVKWTTGIEQAPSRPPRQWFLRPPGRHLLAAEVESLEVQVARLAQGDSLWRGVVASDHDVVAIVPAPLLSAVVTEASRRYFSGADVDIRPTKVVQLNQLVRARVLGSRVGVGRIKGTVLISHLKGRLTVAGEPRVALEPPSDLVVTAPIQIVAGRGTVTMDMDWHPAFLVGLVCRGFQFHESLAGDILPFRDELTMRIRCSIRDSSIEGRMRVQRDVIHFSANLTDSSWNKILADLAKQDRFARCGMVMNPDSVLFTLKQLARRGVNIRLPEGLFKPFRLPVMLVSQYTAGDYRITARAFDPAITVNAQYLRLAFRANLSVSAVVPNTRSNPASVSPSPESRMSPRK
jgi:hypothetical protein